MANKKDFATSTVLTAPSPTDTGTSLVVQSGHGARFPAAPFYITAHPPSEFPTLDNAEKILVTDKTSDTFTIDRGEGDTVAQYIEAGWRISNAVFLDDFPDTFDDLTDGTTNKAFTGTEKTKLSDIEIAADVTDAGNVGSSIHGASSKITPVDADTVPLIDSEASNVLKKLTWANLKAAIKSYYDSVSATMTNKTLTSPVLNTGVSGTAVLDEDDMSSNSNTKVATQQSIKAYVDASITAAKSALLPVGSIVVLGVSTNPATLYGFGTWTAIAGRVLVGKDASGTFSTLNATGGAETHTLTEAQMPVHNHSIDTYYGAGGGYISAAISNAGTLVTRTTGNKGGGNEHNNLQPYIVKYMWQRTA